MTNKGNLSAIITDVMKQLNFIKKSSSWYRNFSDVIQVVNVQGSAFEGPSYLNVGVYLKELGDKKWPTEYQCHIRSRIDYQSKSIEEVLGLIEDWFTKYGRKESLSLIASSTVEFPPCTSKATKEFFGLSEKFTCPCCGYYSFESKPGSHEICPICYWEDDLSQLREIYSLGANKISLVEAQQNFIECGACEPRFVKDVRKPSANDKRDLNWQTISQIESKTDKKISLIEGEPPYYWFRIR